MKKVVCLLLAIMVTVCLAGCTERERTTTSQPTINNSLHQVRSGELEKNTAIHSGLSSVLPDLKEMIKEALGEYDFLDWEQFENVSEIREFKDPNLAGDFADKTAFYATGSGIIVVCPNFFSIKEGDQQTYTLTHELIHSLVGVGKVGAEDTMCLFMEGVTDYLANLVLFDTGLEYSLNYQNELYCISWLMALYGNNEITKTICGGEIINFVNEQVGNTDAGTILHNSLLVLDKSKDREDVKNAILNELDILRTISGSNIEVREKFTKIFETAYAPYLN